MSMNMNGSQEGFVWGGGSGVQPATEPTSLRPAALCWQEGLLEDLAKPGGSSPLNPKPCPRP